MAFDGCLDALAGDVPEERPDIGFLRLAGLVVEVDRLAVFLDIAGNRWDLLGPA